MRHRNNMNWIHYANFILSDGSKKRIMFRLYKGRIIFNITKKDVILYNLPFHINQERKFIKNNLNKLIRIRYG